MRRVPAPRSDIGAFLNFATNWPLGFAAPLGLAAPSTSECARAQEEVEVLFSGLLGFAGAFESAVRTRSSFWDTRLRCYEEACEDYSKIVTCADHLVQLVYLPSMDMLVSTLLVVYI